MLLYAGLFCRIYDKVSNTKTLYHLKHLFHCGLTKTIHFVHFDMAHNGHVILFVHTANEKHNTRKHLFPNIICMGKLFSGIIFILSLVQLIKHLSIDT